MLPKTLQRLLSDPRVESISDERGTGDGYWIYLNRGFWCRTMETGTIHEYTVRNVLLMFRDVEPDPRIKPTPTGSSTDDLPVLRCLPARFFRDQLERCLEVGEPITWTEGGRVWVWQTPTETAECADDARLYAEGYTDADPTLRRAAKILTRDLDA